MPLFPKISSPCPYADDLAAIMDGDVCRMCRRQVFDLTAMNDGERLAFLAGCEEEVCVSYSIPIGPALRTAAIAAAIVLPSAASATPRTQPLPEPVPVAVVAGGIMPAPEVQVVEVPSEATPVDVAALYEKEAKPEPEQSPAKPRGD